MSNVGGVIGFLARTGAARRARTGLVLALLLGIAGAAVLASWAGARRTDTAFSRLRAATAHADLIVASEQDPALFDPAIAVDAPGVHDAGIANGYPMVELLPDGTPDLAADNVLIAPADDVAFQTINLPVVLDGRVPSGPNEILVPEDMATAGYAVGHELDACFFEYEAAVGFRDGVVVAGTAAHEDLLAFVDEVCEVRRLEVVGVSGPGPDEVVLREDEEEEGASFPVGSPAFADDVVTPRLFSFVVVDLADGADPAAYIDAVLDRAVTDAGVSTQASAVRVAVVGRTLEPYVRALALFAALAALAAAAVLGPALSRWAGTDRGDLRALGALGIRPAQLRLAAAARGAALGAAAAVVAVGVAWAVSGRFPIGIAADIEPAPGRRADGVVLGAGTVALVLIGSVLGAVAPAGEGRTARRPSRLAAGLQSLGVGPGPVAGVRAASAGDGRGPGLLRTVGGVAVAVTSVVAALTYQSGLARLLDSPERQGWVWDLVVDGANEGVTTDFVAALAQSEHIEEVSTVRRMTLQHEGKEVHAFAFEAITGDVGPLVLEGRAPVGDDEIALGQQALDRLDARVGSRLEVRGPSGGAAEVTVVGRTLVPLTVLGSVLSVSEGGVVDLPVMDRFGGADPELVVFDLSGGADLADVEAILEEAGPEGIGGRGVEGPSHSADLRGYHAVRSTPTLLAGLLAVLGIGVIGHTVATSVRRRRRELSMLRVLGFSSRQLRSSVRWDVLTLVGVCVLIAVPVGVAIGRVLWAGFADSIGVVDDALTPVVAVLAVAAVTMAITLLSTLVPGRQATRLRPAEVLRTE